MHSHVLYLLLLAPGFLHVLCFPIKREDPQNSTQEADYDYELYDQRQNGTENYRIHVNGVVFMLAPLQSLLSMPSIFDAENPDEDGDDEVVVDVANANSNVTEIANQSRQRKHKYGMSSHGKPDRNALVKQKVSKLKQHGNSRPHGAKRTHSG